MNKTKHLLTQALQDYQSGHIDKAIILIEKAITLDPQAQHYNSLGYMHNAKNDLKMATACYKKALALDPNSLDALTNLSSVYHTCNQIDAAKQCLHKALTLNPNHALAHYNLGLLYQLESCFDNAITHFQHALTHAPDDAQTANNLGHCLLQQGDIHGARKAFEHALDNDSNALDALANYGICLQLLGHLKQAQLVFQQVIDNDPTHPAALLQLGNVYQELGQWENAKALYGQVLQQEPHNKHALGLLTYSEIATADWQPLQAHMRILQAQFKKKKWDGLTPFQALHLVHDNQTMLHIAKARALKSAPEKMHAPRRKIKKDKLTIAYISADFYHHPIGFLFRDIFKHHDRARFHIIGYMLGNQHDSYTNTVASSCDEFFHLAALSNAQAAEKIVSDKVDILIDLSGHTRSAKQGIFALKPSPIHCHSIGYPGTLGADYVDYYITHPMATPEHLAPYFTESLAYLPETLIATPALKEPTPTLTRKDVGLPINACVYCCFNKTGRINEALFCAWLRILQAVPKSVLWLQSHNEAAKARLIHYAKRHGMHSDRIIFTALSDLTQHWHHCLADVGLDTFSISAGTASIIFAWSALPVVTLAGTTAHARTGAAIAVASGLPDLIAESVEDYCRLAIELGHDPSRRQALRSKLSALRTCSALFQPPRYIRHLESAYQTMWQYYVENHKPKYFYVERM